jgi:hypothetical protein
LLFEEILQSKTVHDCSKHSHVVSPTTIHAAFTELCATEIIAATDNDCHLDARTHNFSNLAGDVLDGIWVNAQPLTASKRFTG